MTIFQIYIKNAFQELLRLSNVPKEFDFLKIYPSYFVDEFLHINVKVLRKEGYHTYDKYEYFLSGFSRSIIGKQLVKRFSIYNGYGYVHILSFLNDLSKSSNLFRILFEGGMILKEHFLHLISSYKENTICGGPCLWVVP